MTTLVSFDRVFEVLNLPPAIAERADARPIPAGPARVEFDQVDFGYPAAEDVSLASLESVASVDRDLRPAAAANGSGLGRPTRLSAVGGRLTVRSSRFAHTPSLEVMVNSPW